MRALDLDEIDEGVNLACAGAVRKGHSDAIKNSIIQTMDSQTMTGFDQLENSR